MSYCTVPYRTVLYWSTVFYYCAVAMDFYFSHHTSAWRLDDWGVRVSALYCGEGERLVFEENEKGVVLIGYFFGYKRHIQD